MARTKASQTLEKFFVKTKLRSQHGGRCRRFRCHILGGDFLKTTIWIASPKPLQLGEGGEREERSWSSGDK